MNSNEEIMRSEKTVSAKYKLTIALVGLVAISILAVFY